MTTLQVVGGTKRRKYTKRVKIAAVLATEAAGVVAASRQTGIPATTIEYWLNKPEFAELRTKAREDLAEEYKVAAHLTISRLVELVPTMEARDIIAATETAVKLTQLLTGQATARTETRELTEGLDDHEKAALRAVLDEVLAATEPV